MRTETRNCKQCHLKTEWVGYVGSMKCSMCGSKFTKSPERLAIQKALVCAYLRTRWAREQLKNYDMKSVQYDIHLAELCEAHNCLESLKRVLWNNDWS
jgi:hypothetical protein